MIARAIATQVKFANIPKAFEGIRLTRGDGTPFDPKLFRDWYLDHPLILTCGAYHNKMAAAILQHTFTFNPSLIYPQRAHYADAYEAIGSMITRGDDYLFSYRHLALCNIDSIDEYRLLPLVSLLRRRIDAARVTIVTTPIISSTFKQLPDDLRQHMSAAKIEV